MLSSFFLFLKKKVKNQQKLRTWNLEIPSITLWIETVWLKMFRVQLFVIWVCWIIHAGMYPRATHTHTHLLSRKRMHNINLNDFIFSKQKNFLFVITVKRTNFWIAILKLEIFHAINCAQYYIFNRVGRDYTTNFTIKTLWIELVSLIYLNIWLILKRLTCVDLTFDLNPYFMSLTGNTLCLATQFPKIIRTIISVKNKKKKDRKNNPQSNFFYNSKLFDIPNASHFAF